MSSDSWKLEKDLCRCCHAEGSFHSLSEPRIILGQEEKYAEMLRSSMNIHLSPAMGLLSEMTYTICEACILRVRDAFNFKRQVLLCEERFKDIYKNVVKSLDPVLNAELVKQEVPGGHQQNIKIEVSVEDDDDDFGMGWDDADDDKSVLQLQLEDSRKKGKAKAKPKPKPQPKPKAMKALPKKVVPVRKTKDLTQSASASTPQPDISTPKSKKGSYEDEFTYTQGEDGTKTFSCNTCSHTFEARRYFTQHFARVHLGQGLERPCPICKLKVSKCMRAIHMENAHGRPAPKCEVCDKTFASAGEVLVHQKMYHTGDCKYKGPYDDAFTLEETENGSNIFTCNICSRAFASRKNFTQHYTHVHLKRRPRLRSCKMCNVKVPTHLRAAHMEEAHGLPAPTCLACNRKFGRPDLVLRHQRIHHMGEKDYACKDCNVRFGSRHDLSKHEAKHTGVRCYRCDYCAKSFKYRNNLRSHILIHLDIRRHICEVCGDAFVQQSSLSYHVKKRHLDSV